MSKSILTSLHGRRIGLAADGSLVLNKQNGDQETLGQTAYKLITSAQLLALNATPQTIIAAPGPGLAALPRKVLVRHGGGTAYAGVAAGEDLVLKYTNGSGAECSPHIETTGFLDQTTAQIRAAGDVGAAGAVGSHVVTANADVVLHLLVGEITTGDFDLHVKVWYDVVRTGFTS